MTQNQKSVLKWMSNERIGAICFDGGWKFPQHFRDNEELADKFIARGLVSSFEAEIVRS